MHRVLNIPELLQIILTYLDFRDMVHMSRVRRNFWAPAAALLWRKLPSTIPLSCFLVDPVLTTDGPVILSCRYSAINLGRFRLYASFVREIRLDTNRFIEEYPIFFIFMLFAKGPLFPNLRRLEIDLCGVLLSQNALDALLSPSLEHLSIKLPRRSVYKEHAEAFVTNILHAFYTKLARLKDFHLRFGHPTTSHIIPAIIKSLSSRSFERLSIESRESIGPAVDVAALVGFLSQAEVLKRVAFTLDDFELVPDLPRENEFATLSTLELRGPPTSMLQLVALIEAPQVENISLHACGTRATLHRVGDCPNLMGFGRFGFLQTFKMDFKILSTPMSFEHIRPLTNCYYLESITMYFPDGSALNRSHLEEMVTAWPHLTLFAIDGATFTALDLPIIFKSCPLLEDLEIPIDTTILEHGLPESIPLEWVATRLTKLNFLSSILGEYGDRLAQLIGRLCPNLERVHVDWPGDWIPVWKRVQKITGREVEMIFWPEEEYFLV
ncbi:hypothetical protein FRB99_006156 [Tulasnella sp. 403]|nr:hypothetical protein FRB99_006156 [Tulasnella sp. 403]